MLRWDFQSPSKKCRISFLFVTKGGFTYLPPFNTITLIKLMNEEEEESPLEDLRVCRNCIAREKHAERSKEQRAVDASRRATQRAAHSDAQITLENVARANDRTLLHPDR